MSRTILPLLAGFTLLGNVAIVSAGDLADITARRIVAAQKMKAQVKSALDQSRTWEQTRPTDARNLLERTLRDVNGSQDLAPADQTSLRRQLTARLSEVNNAVRRAKVDQEQRSIRDIERPRFTPSTRGKEGSAFDLAKNTIGSNKSATGTYRDMTREREKRFGQIARNSDTSSIPTDEAFTLPKYWKHLTESRKKMFGPKLTEKEAKVLKTLNSTISVNYTGEKFKSVLDALQDRTGLTLIMDEASVQDLGLDYDDPVKLKLNKVSVRTALKKVLGDRGLTYIIKEGALQVMTPKKAAEYTVVRSYPIDGLIAPNQFAMMYGPFVAQAQMLANVQSLINTITSTIEPNYWQPNGPGTITFYPPTMSLSIRASAEMHYSLPGLLGR